MSKQISTQAAAAKLIRQELKSAFPSIKFSVTSTSYSGGNSIRVSWTNGPTTDAVNAIIQKYQYGHFNGMTDCYEYSNSRKDIPQVQFVLESREFDSSIIDSAFEFAKKYFDWIKGAENLDSFLVTNGRGYTPRQEIMYMLWNMDLTNGFSPEMLRIAA